MAKAAATAVVVIALAFIAVVGLLVANNDDPPTRAERVALERARVAEIEAERDARLDEIAEARKTLPIRSAFATVAVALLWTLVIFLCIGIIYYGVRRRDFTIARRDGRLPVALSSLSYTDALSTVRAIADRDYAHASNTGVPQAVTYSPTYAPKWTNRQNIEGLEPQQILGPVNVLWSQRATGDVLYLGEADDGQPVTHPWKGMVSIAVAGKSGCGKSTTATSLLAQCVLAGHRVMLCDPHAGDAEQSLHARLGPFRDRLWQPTAAEDDEISDALLLALGVLGERRKGDPDRTPITIGVDELGGLARREVARVPEMIEEIAVEGRKFAVNAVVLTQRWSSTRTPTDMRNVFPLVLMHRCRVDDARMLTGLDAAELPRDMMGLEPGHAYAIRDADQIRRVRVPAPTLAELAAAADGQLPVGSTDASRVGPERVPVAGSTVAAEGPGPALDSAVDPKMARAVAMFHGGVDRQTCVKMLCGGAAPGTGGYNRASKAFDDALRAHGRRM